MIVTSDIVIQAIISGLQTGFIFALVAVGLSLIFGMMDVVNFAHGEMLMVAMYLTYWMSVIWHLDPLASLPITALIMFGVGVSVYFLVVKRTLKGPMVAQMFATFGLAVILTNAAQFLWTAEVRSVQDPISAGRVVILGFSIGRPHLVASVGALLGFGLVYWLLTRTDVGRAMQATSQDRQAASLMGINTDWMFALAWGIAAACVGVAGALLANYYPVTPTVGTIFVLSAYVAVALGGFGSIPGALLGALLIGLTQVIAGVWLGPQLKLALVYMMFLAVVLVRPMGLLGRR